MSFAFTTDGLTIQTYQEIYDELVTGYQAAYGPDINVDPDSPDGQRIGIEAKARLDAQAFIQALYSQMDPDFAAGEWLNTVIKWAGLSRRPASQSSVDVTITTDRDLTLPAGYTVNDDLDQSWVLSSATACTTGANAITLLAENFGAVEADAGTVTDPATVVLGVVSVTNAAAAAVGLEEETDPELRIRRNASLASPATSTVGGLYTALSSVAGVSDVAIYENDTNSYDAGLDLDRHTIWCIVEGGEISDIVETIAKNKTGGTGLKGTESGDYIETLYRPDGTPYYIIHTMWFDRPTYTPVYVTLTVEGVDGAFVDTDAIKAALAALDLHIGDALTASELYRTVYSTADNFTATLLEISDDDIAYTDGRLTPDADAAFTIAVGDITITDIT